LPLHLHLGSPIQIVDEMNQETLSETVFNILNELHVKEISVAIITCDGASCQVKALNFQGDSSIQKQNSETERLSKLLFIPCLCHQLANAYLCPFQTFDRCGAMIISS
jgi:hypothetical protein